MIRFQCPHCRGIVAAEVWEPGEETTCAYCSEIVKMPAERLSPGAVLGDFMLVRKLGAGGMGVVYLAHQLSLDRPAAIKILNSEFSQEAESVQAFVREARSAAKINHPNLVQAYAVGEEDGIFFFAMEFLDGNTMKEVLQSEKKIEPRRAAMIIMQVADALDCAWREQKLIHRDIKPDNIMQCGNDRFKLADLGLAGTFGDDNNEDSDEVIGTPQYINPEQLTGRMTDTRSDIYSLGATFYHFVTGRFPFYDENIDEIAKKHLTEELVPPVEVDPQLPKVLSDIIVKMMAKDPAQRYQNCGELIAELRAFLNNASAPRIAIPTPAAAPAAAAPSAAPAAEGGKLVSGGNMSVQPKIQPGGSGIKLSLKPVENKPINTPVDAGNSDSQSDAKSVAPQAAAKSAAGTPAAPAAAPKISLSAAPAPQAAAPKLAAPQAAAPKAAAPQAAAPKSAAPQAAAPKSAAPQAAAPQAAAPKTAAPQAAAPKAAAPQAAAPKAAAPKAAPAGAKINLNRPSVPKTPVPAPVEKEDPLPIPENEPELTSEDTGAETSAKTTAEESVFVPEKTPAEKLAELLEKKKKQKKLARLIAFLIILVICGGAVAGGFYYHKSSKAASAAAAEAAKEIKLERKADVTPAPAAEELEAQPRQEEDPLEKMSFIQVLGELRKKCNSDLGGFARLEKSTFVEDWVKWEAWRRDNAGLANAKAANNAETQLFSELQKRYVFLQKAYTLKYMSIYKRDEFLSRWNSLYGQLKPADNRERAVCDQLYRIYVEKYAGSLFDLASSNGDRFVQMWRNGENIKFQKIIKTADDRMLYQRLFDTFMLVSENKINAQRDAAKKRFDSQRQSIINKQLRSQKNAEYAAKRKRYQEREAAAERLSLSSEQEYIKDLPRKMARLDVALLAVGTNRKNWNLLIKELKWARQEKTRLKDHPELHNAAELLIEYADIVERIAEQGRYFTDTVLARQTMRGKFVEDEKRMVTVIQSNARLLVLRDLQKAVPGGRPQKVESVRLDLVKGNIKFNNQWIRSVETLCGRSDQYFYYMMFNGYWQDCRDLEEIAPVADRQYWRNRNIENMAYNCFKLMLWQTNNDGVEALKRRFNSWKIFHKALNDFQSEMR